MKCLGRQTRPTYSPERRALHLFGNRFPLRPEYRPVLSCAWYEIAAGYFFAAASLTIFTYLAGSALKSLRQDLQQRYTSVPS
jgi:hypothetical protein